MWSPSTLEMLVPLSQEVVYESGIGCVQVGDAEITATTKDVIFADAREWKVQGRHGSCPNKRDHDRGVEMPFVEGDESAGENLATANNV